MKEPVFAKPCTFMGVPQTQDLTGAHAAILGIPFDCGTHPTRVGARYGPFAIREQSALVRPFQPPFADFNPLQQLSLVDCGNVAVVPSDIELSFDRIEQAVWHIVSQRCVALTLGGDGAVTLPQLRAVHRQYPELAVLHIDAHTDAFAGDGSIRQRYNTATTFTRAAEEQVLDVAHTIHVGPRGSLPAQHVFEHTRALGYELIDGEELFHKGIAQVARHVRNRLTGRPVYLCFDMDFFDPSCAPGVCAPTWGGANAREGLTLLRELAGLDFVAFDINTVSPPHDVGGMTACLASTVVLECLTLACQRGALGVQSHGMMARIQ